MASEPQQNQANNTGPDAHVEVARITRSGAITAAVITGVLAVVASAIPFYFLGHKQGEASAAQPTVTTTVTAPAPQGNGDGADSASPSAKPSMSTKAWTDVEAVFTTTDGKQIRMPASTVRFCISTGTGVRLDESRDVPFDKMIRLTVESSTPALTPGGTAKLTITLVGGSTPLVGTITSGCDFIGQADTGRVSYYPDKLASIQFER